MSKFFAIKPQLPAFQSFNSIISSALLWFAQLGSALL